MRRVAGDAAFGLYRRMFKGERPSLIDVASGTDLLLRAGRTQLPFEKSAMLVVAVGTADEFLFHTMVEWFAEFSFRVGMAAVAELRLRRAQ